VTLVLALACSEGLVLAADGQSTIGTTGQPVKMATDKLNLPWRNVAWSAAGQVALMQRLEKEFGKTCQHPNTFEKKTVAEIRQKVTSAVVASVRPVVLQQFVQVKGQAPADTAFLFVGYASDGPFIVEVAQTFLDHDHIGVGYCAIGSGDIFPYYALAVLKHYGVQDRSLPEAKLIAYRVLEDAISVAAFGIGEPISMIEIPKPPTGQSAHARKLSTDELRVLKDKVAEWKAVESEVLTEIGVPAPAPASAPADAAGEADSVVDVRGNGELTSEASPASKGR
jgi:20S proteasome alpha/beta subunit